MHRLSSNTNEGLHLIIPFRHSAFCGHGRHFPGLFVRSSISFVIVESQKDRGDGCEYDDKDDHDWNDLKLPY